MQKLSDFFHKLITLLEKVKTGNEIGQFVVSLAILLFGFIILEALWRYGNRKIEAKLDRKGFKNWLPYLSGFLPAIRLAVAVLLLRIAELPLVIPPKLLVLLHGLELFLLAVASILFIFQLVRILDFFVSILPSDIQEKISEAFLTNFKTILRITGIVIAAIVFIYSQKNLFPEWLWKSAWWRYLSLVLLYAVIYSGGNFLITFMNTLTVALRDAEEKTRLRLVLKACLWPIRLLLLAIAVYATQEILKLPGTVDRIAESIANILGTLVIVIFLYRLLDVVEYELTKFVTREDNELDLNFVQMVRIVARVLIVVFGFIYLLKAATGKPMTTLLAGLGIGGLAVALAEMAFAGGLGIEADLRALPKTADCTRTDVQLFSESNSRFVIEVQPDKFDTFAKLMLNLPFGQIGKVVEQPRLIIRAADGGEVINAEIEVLKKAWQKTFDW